MSPEQVEMLKVFIDPVTAILVLILGWFIGQWITLKWNLIQKKRETDIAILQQFYSLYGEFKEVSKIWRVIKRKKDPSLKDPPESRWSLLTRACAVESKNEAIMVKIVTERDLKADDLRALGLFRQAIQQARESIRDDEEIPAADRHSPEYAFFNILAVKVGSIISSSDIDESSNQENAAKRLITVVEVRSQHYRDELKCFECSQKKT